MSNNTDASNQTLGNGSEPFVLKSEVAKILLGSTAAYEYEQEGHRRTYARVRDIYAFVREVHKNSKHSAEWNEVRRMHQVPVPKEGANPFAQYTSVLSGEFHPTKTVDNFEGVKDQPKWLPRRSDEKYAKVIRWLWENKVEVDAVVDTIDKFVHSKDKSLTKVLGIMQADSDKHAVKRAPRTWKGDMLKRAQSAPGRAEIPAKAVKGFATHDGFCLAVVRVHNGKAEIICDGKATSDRIVALITDQEGQWKGNKTITVREGMSVELQSQQADVAA